ncbi:hypothetical protein CHS0354_005525 [Potamilus streckersoni]|uniref:Uncharacterized protein n=1 Tax=Potamilus streckersoni TaxID=2493646 RepID=A0AAE0VTH6_9BIVA|nr:hypothetical protein CHS0354_005525 [Potamilus streckersoni]
MPAEEAKKRRVMSSNIHYQIWKTVGKHKQTKAIPNEYLEDRMAMLETILQRLVACTGARGGTYQG